MELPQAPNMIENLLLMQLFVLVGWCLDLQITFSHYTPI